jgi:ligand-binding sensor domain-containing protein
MKTPSLHRPVTITSTFLCLLMVSIVTPTTAGITTYLPPVKKITTMIDGGESLWAGTMGSGLVRLDKTSGALKVYTTENSPLLSNTIQALTLDTTGALLIGMSTSTVQRFDGTGWDALPPFSKNDRVGSLAVDETGAVWAGITGVGAVRLEGNTWKTIVSTSGRLITDPEKNIWYVVAPKCSGGTCSDGNVFHYRSGSLQNAVSLDALWSQSTGMNAVAVDMKHHVWIGARNELIKLGGGTMERFAVDNDTFPYWQVTALAATMNDELLIGLSHQQDSGKILMYDQINDAGSPVAALPLAACRDFAITAACENLQGGFRVATSEGCILSVNNNREETSYCTGNAPLTSSNVTSLLFDASGSGWIGTDNGICRYDGAAWTLYDDTHDSLPGPQTSALALDRTGVLWAGFKQSVISAMVQCGLSRFSGGTWHLYSRDAMSIHDIAFDSTNRCWFIGETGIFREDDTGTTTMLPVSWTDSASYVYSIAFDGNNTPWVGTAYGVRHYENGSWLTDAASERAVDSLKVNCILFDPAGNRWVGTDGGLFVCTGDQCSRTDVALPNDTVTCMAFADEHRFWVGTRGGVAYCDTSGTTTFTVASHGLPGNVITSIALRENGDAWIGVNLGGVVVITPDEVANSEMAGVGRKTHASSFTVTSRNSSGAGIRYHFIFGEEMGSQVSIRVMALDGRIIREISSANQGGRTKKLTWDGTGASGRKASSGIYIAVVRVDGGVAGARRFVCR